MAGIEKPLESCNVCHGDNSLAEVGEAHALSGQVAVSVTEINEVEGDLVVSYTVTLDGAPGQNFTYLRSDYRFDGDQRIDLSGEGHGVTLGGGDGEYTATIAGGASIDDSRYLIRFADEPNNDFGTRDTAVLVFDYPASPHDDVLASGACANCHGENSVNFHYDYPVKAENCTVCHDASNTAYPWYINLGHGIHNSHNMPDGEYQLVDKNGDPLEEDGEILPPVTVTYPTYMTNCSVCHAGHLDEVNAMPVTYAGCLSCHGSMESWEETWLAKPAIDFHAAYDETIVCTDCHRSTALPDLDTVAEMHNGLETERVGIIWNGEDLSVSEGKKFNWEIKSVVDNGTNLTISWTAEYPKGTPINPCNMTATATAPVFLPADAIEGQLSVLRSFAQGDDYVLGQASGPGQASSTNLYITGSYCPANQAPCTINTSCSTTSPFTATSVVPRGTVPAGATKGRIAIQGRPLVPVPAGFEESHHAADWPHDTMYVRVPSPTYEYVLGTGAKAASRRVIADTTQCLKCHVGSLYQHGNTRIDNVDLCVMCHNSASNDQNNRVTMGVDASEGYDGKVGQTYEFKTLLHALHTVADVEFLNPASKTTAIYRTRGIYAWAPEGVTPPNWTTAAACKVVSPIANAPAGTPPAYVDVAPFEAVPPNMTVTTTGNIVNGASTNTDGTYPTVACQPHNLYHPTFPRAPEDCAACHKAGFSTIVDQTKGVATTINAGKAPWNNQLDDVLQGANSAACTSCHRDAATIGHANQNGWVPTTFPNGRQTIIDAAK